ncbi:transcription elongation factor Elf1 like-domain-containing protein [Pyronema domesticum]|nr:transcription elongation factor Elf1 like-domain-containing protein [Pyronema domesticum]
MGKRKKSSRKPQGPKKREPLNNTFNCLFCNHEDSVTCKLDKKAGIGSLSCKVCAQAFQSNINYLSHAVDVYSDWVDACDEIVDGKGGGPKSAESRRLSRAKPASRRDADGDDEPSGSGPRGGRAAPDDDSDGDLEDIDDDEQIAPRRSARDMDDDELEDDEDF